MTLGQQTESRLCEWQSLAGLFSWPSIWPGDYYICMQGATSGNVCNNFGKVMGPVDVNAGDSYPALPVII
jgi:hypothetical protein